MKYIGEWADYAPTPPHAAALGYCAYGCCPIPLRDFTWNRQRRMLSAEASDLGYRAGHAPPMHISVLSSSGVVQKFGQEWVERDARGDVLVWRYAALDPTCRVRELHVIND